jgi:hypothetical protein
MIGSMPLSPMNSRFHPTTKTDLREAEEKLEELNSMSEAQATIRATHQYENEIEYYRKSEARRLI